MRHAAHHHLSPPAPLQTFFRLQGLVSISRTLEESRYLCSELGKAFMTWSPRVLSFLGQDAPVSGLSMGTCHSHPSLCSKHSPQPQRRLEGERGGGKSKAALEETAQKHPRHTTAALLDREGAFISFVVSGAKANCQGGRDPFGLPSPCRGQGDEP